jgi:hypothetical protein
MTTEPAGHQPEPLPQTTTERLLKVAEIIETAPQAWRQSTWAHLNEDELNEYERLLDELDERDFDSIKFNQGRDDHTCGTRCCIAGWGVRYTPKDVDLFGFGWSAAGRMAFGLDYSMAGYLFHDTFAADVDDSHVKVAHLLRKLAEVPEGQRTLDYVERLVGTDGIVAELCGRWFR